MKKIISLAILFAAYAVSMVSAQQALPTSGGYYLIKNQGISDCYIGGTGSGDNSVRIEKGSLNTEYHYFLLTEVNSGEWTMKQVKTDRYITHNNSYVGSYATATSNNRQLFKFVNTVDPAYIVIQKKKDDGSFDNAIGSDNTGTDGGEYIYMNKGTDKNNKWLFVSIDADLQAAINKATALYGDGSGTGAADLNTAISTAQSALNSTMTSSNISSVINGLSAAVTALNTAINTYKLTNGLIVTMPTSGGYYLVKNQGTGNTYIGGTGTAVDGVKHENATTNPLYHYFLVEGDNTNGWTLKQVYTNRYVTHGGTNEWDGCYADARGDYRQLFYFDTSKSTAYTFITHKNSDGSFATKGIGHNNGKTDSGETLYFDKPSDSQYNNKWLFEDATAEVIANIFVPQLSALISTATTFVGSDTGDDADDLNAAIITASGFLSSTSVSAIQTAISDLQAAIDAYVVLNPVITVLAEFEGSDLFNSYARDWAQDNKLTVSNPANPASTCLNYSTKSLLIKDANNNYWYDRALLKKSDDTPIAITSLNKYLHIMFYSAAANGVTLRFKDTSSRSWDNGNDDGNAGNNQFTIPAGWSDKVLDLTQVNITKSIKGLTSLYGIYFGGHPTYDDNRWEYYVDNVILSSNDIPRTCPDYIVDNVSKSDTEYKSGQYGNIIFRDGGQLSLSSPLAVEGVVKVEKQFAKDTWYAVGFPFAIANVSCDVDIADATYDKTTLQTYDSGGTGGDSGDYWLKTYDGANDEFIDYTAGATSIAAGGYALQVPDALHNATFTFTSGNGLILSNSSGFATESGSYKLTYNPSVANTQLTQNNPDNYYILGNNSNFGLITSYSLKPFESVVVAQGIASNALRSSLNIETITGINEIPANDAIKEVRYYNLQGVEIPATAHSAGVFIVKTVYQSGAVNVSKIIRK